MTKRIMLMEGHRALTTFPKINNDDPGFDAIVEENDCRRLDCLLRPYIIGPKVSSSRRLPGTDTYYGTTSQFSMVYHA